MKNQNTEDYIKYIMEEVSDEKIEELFRDMGIEIDLKGDENADC